MRLHVLLVCSLRSLPPGSAAEELVGSSACSQCSAHSALNEAVQPTSLPFRLFFLEGLEESKELQKSPRGVKSVLETLEESTEPGREPLGVISGH